MLSSRPYSTLRTRLTKMQNYRCRVRTSCDGCALRRVKCSGSQPCLECSKRSTTCTFLRLRRKRGPKGLRIQTAEKIEENAEILANATTLPSDPVPTAVGTEYGDSEASTIASRDSDTVLSSYHYYLTIFRERLYSVWPIVDPGRLASRLAAGDKDHEANALAAALSLGVIAQLRLPNSTESEHLVHKSVLLHETKRLQSITDYQKSCTLDSLLTSFFLHIYYANIQKLSAATYLLRETLTTAHMLKLHHPEAYKSLPSEEYELRLRVYWILFVTERYTYLDC